MAPNSVSSHVEVEELSMDTDGCRRVVPGARANVIERLSHEMFKYDHLDRRLKRHHVTGLRSQGVDIHSLLTSERNRVLWCRRHRFVPDFGAGRRDGRSRWRLAGIPLCWTRNLLSDEILGRNGFCPACQGSHHGLP